MDSWSTISSTEFDNKILAIESKRALAYLQKNRKYRYIEFLHQGGYGWVSRVYDDKAGKPLVIKCTSDPGEMELSWWPKLDHPNILPLYEIITLKRVTVFIMPTMRKDLWEVVHRTSFYKEELSFGLSRVWLRNVASALAYLHGQFLCHLDLKLDNVFLKEDGFVCLGDFSLLSDMRKVPKDFSFLEKYEPPEFTQWCYDVQMSESSTTTSGDKADMWQYGILAVDLLCNLKNAIYKSSPYKLMHHDVWLLLEKIFLHNEYLSSLLEKTFISVVFKQEDFSQCYDFFKKILRVKPEHRISAEEAMAHPFIKTEWPQLPAEFTLPTVVDEDGQELLQLPIEEIKDPSMTVEEVMAASAEEVGKRETLPDSPSKGKELLEIKPDPSVKRFKIFDKKPLLGKKDAVVKTTVVEKRTPTGGVQAKVKVTAIKRKRSSDSNKSAKKQRMESCENIPRNKSIVIQK